ncbi:MAG: TrbG/VirB9 family P-type conjugative transfer protein [Erythrobacter sp.]
MIRFTLFLAALALWAPTSAQTFPTPNPEAPRIQSVEWRANQTIVLTALPKTSLTVMLEPGETITRATLQGLGQWDVSVSAEANTFQIRPEAGAAPSRLSVETNVRAYEFALEVGEGLLAAYLVKLKYEPDTQQDNFAEAPPITGLDWSYRLRGDRSVRPASIRDNGAKTVIEYAPGQPLPAVFAIGASGDEEVVDGYMRGDLFVIDRVHQELVFRIDKEKATAKRNSEQDELP